ncbi:putative membrane protein [Myxococcus xanthus DK 1622]|uniref:Membrane protein n=1 Tax=Myxococcus xanthus (strain DK1622) TaxID=246197 RepID=Q1D7K1_MYXXD|nr:MULTISPECIES: DUF808 domain-containing protein [Myxococcus]ABF89170.1 putative membrane protein [Myxococcus xanthus DK 1622]NOJ52897.1 DUF808 domain-containing protein [Myxococcus xanthus]QPM82620.1 DUF808 domain-containing protein [Myxococcus xanthus]QVW64925.1 DUF808 domain-containing protein [Myxococcus xanthus DZ2]QZZ50879.1 Inner membrane protein YedI [Myxococcus xanthus]
MAGSSLLTLIDDIASLLDDIAAMTKVATRKTAGVLGDDLALNAQQVSGVSADRELPVVWAVAKGSMVNKAILVPAALAISALAPWAIIPLLMLGGAFLCFEGFEKVAQKFLHGKEEQAAQKQERVNAVADPSVDLVAMEKDKIKGAIRTDFILSAEIVVISLGTLTAASFGMQVAVLTGIALLMTVGVYGLVAGIVKLDDAGLYLMKAEGGVKRSLGRGILATAPYLMKGLGIVGTAAMFMVGGGILTHGIAPLHHFIEHATAAVAAVPGVGGLLGALVPSLMNAVAGVIAGGLIVLLVTGATRAFQSVRAKPS